MATVSLTWQALDITTMTNLYLYGQMTTPANKIDDALIRDTGMTINTCGRLHR
jgi:hypothetical protein